MSVLGHPKFSTWVAAARTGGNVSVVDKVPQEMRNRVDDYWYRYPAWEPLYQVILGLVIGFLGSVSITGNGMVIYIFSSTKALRTPSNLLVVNLAFSDFMMMLCMTPPLIINCYYETWSLGPLMCDIYGTAGSLFGTMSIWTMTLIAFDRYNAIVKGLSGKPLTQKGALLRLLGIWIIALGWTIAPLIGWNRYIPEGHMTTCSFDYISKDWMSVSYIFLYTFCSYFIPLFTIIYSYWFIVQAVAEHEKTMREQAKKMNVASLRSSEAAQTSAECKLAKVALVTISLWFMAWTPYVVTVAIGILDTEKLTPLTTIYCSVFAKASAVYNPIVYGISHPKYRQVLHEKFPWLRCGQQEDDSKSVASGATRAMATEEVKD
uniref:Long wavelength sensitive opsin 2 n=1 Tax=Heterochelus sp. CRS-2017 TaxID=1945606 RepID=A0A1P8SF21_9SCAR|nr:long wavelength sensitive opsin 2 [Heterochelus sp. CRS-2017]